MSFNVAASICEGDFGQPELLMQSGDESPFLESPAFSPGEAAHTPGDLETRVAGTVTCSQSDEQGTDAMMPNATRAVSHATRGAADVACPLRATASDVPIVPDVRATEVPKGAEADCLDSLFEVLYCNPEDVNCPGGKRMHLRLLPKSFFSLPQPTSRPRHTPQKSRDSFRRPSQDFKRKPERASITGPLSQRSDRFGNSPAMGYSDMSPRRHSLPATDTAWQPQYKSASADNLFRGEHSHRAVQRPSVPAVPMMRRWSPNSPNSHEAPQASIPEHTVNHMSSPENATVGRCDALGNYSGDQFYTAPRMINPFSGVNEIRNRTVSMDDKYNAGSRRPSTTREDVVGALPAQFSKRRRREGRAMSMDQGVSSYTGAGMPFKSMHLPGSMMDRRFSLPLDGLDDAVTERAVSMAMEGALTDSDLSNLFGMN